MNEYSERDLGETRSRRAMLATAGGLLLPAGLLALDEQDAEATKRAKRRRRRKNVRWVGNDVIINFRNATSETLRFRYKNMYTVKRAGAYRALDPGKESGFVTGMKPADLIMHCDLDIRLADYPATGDTSSYLIRGTNYEIGTPDAQIWWYSDPDYRYSLKDISGPREMGQNTTLEITHRGYRIHIHRWTNGTEPLDDHDEWYTRFFVTMSNV